MEQVKIEKQTGGVNASEKEVKEVIEDAREEAIEGRLRDALEDAIEDALDGANEDAFEDLPERDGLPHSFWFGPAWLALAALAPPSGA